MGVVLKGTGYTNQISKVKGHLKYIGFRSNEISENKIRDKLKLDKGKFFTKDKNSEDYRNFLKDIETDKRLQHSKSVKAHKMVFSLREVDFDNYIAEGKTYRDLVRSTLDEFSKVKHQNLNWIAVEHLTDGKTGEKSKHPHVHVVIKGVAEDGSRVKLTKEDYQQMRDIFDKEFNKVIEYEKVKKFDRSIERSIDKDITNSIKKLYNDIERDFEKTYIEKEQIRNEEKSRERKR